MEGGELGSATWRHKLLSQPECRGKSQRPKYQLLLWFPVITLIHSQDFSISRTSLCVVDVTVLPSSL